jgi:hypothetical protein
VQWPSCATPPLRPRGECSAETSGCGSGGCVEWRRAVVRRHGARNLRRRVHTTRKAQGSALSGARTRACPRRPWLSAHLALTRWSKIGAHHGGVAVHAILTGALMFAESSSTPRALPGPGLARAEFTALDPCRRPWSSRRSGCHHRHSRHRDCR